MSGSTSVISRVKGGSQVREISVEFVVEVRDRTASRRPKKNQHIIGTSLLSRERKYLELVAEQCLLLVQILTLLYM